MFQVKEIPVEQADIFLEHIQTNSPEGVKIHIELVSLRFEWTFSVVSYDAVIYTLHKRLFLHRRNFHLA